MATVVFFSVPWTWSAGSSMPCAGWQGGIKRRAYLTCFVSVLVMAHSGPVQLALAALICNSDDTENYTTHANLTWNSVFYVSNVEKCTYCRALRFNFYACTYASFLLLTLRLRTEEETFQHQCYICFSLLWQLWIHMSTDVPVLSNCSEPPAAKQPALIALQSWKADGREMHTKVQTGQFSANVVSGYLTGRGFLTDVWLRCVIINNS